MIKVVKLKSAARYKPPSHLTIEAQKKYILLCSEFGIGDSAGQLMVQSACEAYDRLRQAERILRKDGPIITDRWGKPRKHPAIDVERDSRIQLLSSLRLLKLEPSDGGFDR